ncbi:CPBP family intramembrane metalloprotease [Massilia violaceinigra]|uniref:CPBP family intramembrane metalloprotease n=1 Tax=Massilia violaceinigra TaxID=2045208 RepID=A0ABY4A0I2_9BURK|nr:type II CAAX endopeptidase family protein [Massilia violaceinigra]UOD27660.1 CPBP family intramembrane metalloprotease [Massilia violaceinigra]
MPFKILLLILVFGMVVRGAFGIVVTRCWPDLAYFAEHAGIVLLFTAMAFASILQFNLDRRKIALILGNRLRSREFALALAVAGLLLMFTFGESALFTMALAQYSAETAYSLGKYHPHPYAAHPFLSVHVLTFVCSSVILPAIFEEFFFRGLVFRSFNEHHGFFVSAALTALMFTLIHPMKTIYVGTFLFSFVLSYLYATTGSLRPCMVAHAAFNLLAFVNQHYADFHRIRTINELNEWQYWIPQLTMFGIAVAGFGWLLMSSANAIRHASIPSLPPPTAYAGKTTAS